MTALLCDGAAAQRSNRAARRSGAERSISAPTSRHHAEMLIPWSALGVAPPGPAGAQRRVALTSWHRERWMSYVRPGARGGARRPAGWHMMRLATASQSTAPAPRARRARVSNNRLVPPRWCRPRFPVDFPAQGRFNL